MSRSLVGIGPEPLDLTAVVRLLTQAADHPDAADGAIVTFSGTVRGSHHGRRVLWLEYESYDSLAVKVFARIADETAEQWPSSRVAFRHRTGRVVPGETSVIIAAAAPHRAEAFAACRYVIERIKQVAPVWKREALEDGESWVEGAGVHPDDPAARQQAYEKACR